MFTENRETKSASVLVKMTPTQKSIAKELAENKGLNLSQLIMSLLETEFKQIRQERIGVINKYTE